MITKLLFGGNDSLEKYGLQDYLGQVPEAYIANILRTHILSEYGGWYIDADILFKVPIEILKPFEQYEFVCSEVSGNFTFNNSFFGCFKGYDFSEFINEYDFYGPCIPTWNKFLKDKNVHKIPYALVGKESKFIEDLRIGSWRNFSNNLYDCGKKHGHDYYGRSIK